MSREKVESGRSTLRPEAFQQGLAIVGFFLMALLVLVQILVAGVVVARSKMQSSIVAHLAVTLMTFAACAVPIVLWKEDQYWFGGLAYVVGWVIIFYANRSVQRREAIEEEKAIAKSIVEGSQP